MQFQVGSTTWYQHFGNTLPKHLGLDERCISELLNVINEYHTWWRKNRVDTLLKVGGPKILDVDEFTKRNNLFTFTFVRHPFER